MLKKIDKNKPIRITLKTQDNVEIFLGETTTFKDVIEIMDNWLKENPTLLPHIKTFQNNGNNIICNLENTDVIFSNVNIKFTNIKEKFIISPRGEFPFQLNNNLLLH